MEIIQKSLSITGPNKCLVCRLLKEHSTQILMKAAEKQEAELKAYIGGQHASDSQEGKRLQSLHAENRGTFQETYDITGC